MFVCGCIFGASVVLFMWYYIGNKNVQKENDDVPIESLKNALLTLALTTVKKDDVSPLNFNYSEFTGDKYPALSGCSVQNACFSYIFNQAHFKKNAFYSPQYSTKMDAIRKYLHKNLHTQDQVSDLFNQFFKKYVENSFRDECAHPKNKKNEPMVELDELLKNTKLDLDELLTNTNLDLKALLHKYKVRTGQT